MAKGRSVWTLSATPLIQELALEALQAPDKEHLLPSREARLARAVGSPALADTLATVEAGEVLPTLLRWEGPSRKARDSL